MEDWKKIEEIGGNYFVSNLGNIKNKDGKILSFSISNSGYKVVHLYQKSKRTHFYIHILVAKYFVLNQDLKTKVNHKDGDKMNCFYKNLEWCTSSENNLHAKITGLSLQYGETHHSAKLSNEQVNEIKSLINSKAMKQIDIANMYGLAKSTVSQIKNGTRRNVDYRNSIEK